MAYKIVFFDIDGTLVNDDKHIPQDTIEAIRKLKEQQVEVVIATGRAPYYFTHIAKECGIDSFVCFNGSYVVYKGKPIYARHIPQADMEAFQQLAAELGHPLVLQGSHESYSTHAEHPYVVETFDHLKVPMPPSRPDFWKEADIFQALLYCPTAEEDRYHQSLPSLSFIRWHHVSIDVFPKGGSKAQGIEALLRYLGLSPAEAVAFGDGLNDKEMLSFVGMGIAMGNAHDDLKPFSNYITKHVDKGGIAHGLQYAGLIK
ncbi:Cof-type HAD-IIB family hydrolase [Brevibacillus fluminis]|uniref:Cof-type HAD-IIB family hydrolase n=1 Tax=Brevibacillus fluminis TaxID=511487 RepID=A0A3M8DFU1_9BACL|nr:Cof-type HAD-IIB family hydrolase [Brevibacillus fluminis]RNB86972.1 Cof-type HAD-IIB family hydrolase [Brevibacillus fluminis]